MDVHIGNSVACDACENPATQMLSPETSEAAAQWFIGRYCKECCAAVCDEMKEMEVRVKFGKLDKRHCDVELPLRVLESNAGFYIGTFEDEGPNMGPCSRESVEYFPTQAAAIAALETGEWTQRPTP